MQASSEIENMEHGYSVDSNMYDLFPHEWQILCDEGYTGLQESLIVIFPKTKPEYSNLTLSDCVYHKRMFLDHILMGYFFGPFFSFFLRSGVGMKKRG